MHHISVCIETQGKRSGFVVSGFTESDAAEIAESFSNRIGYCGNQSFSEAVTRAGMMERDEPGAWGDNHGICSVCRREQIGKRHEHPCE